MGKILVCDDKKNIRSLYHEILTGEGYEVVEASNAFDANQALIEGGIDVMLLDIKMPGVDGRVMYEVARAFHGEVKVIVSSVYPLSEQKKMIADADDYHDKAEGVDTLLNKVRRFVA